jgi:hypothetical protein
LRDTGAKKNDYEKAGTERNDCAKAGAEKNDCEIPVKKRKTGIGTQNTMLLIKNARFTHLKLRKLKLKQKNTWKS